MVAIRVQVRYAGWCPADDVVWLVMWGCVDGDWVVDESQTCGCGRG